MVISLSDVCLCVGFVRGRASMCGPAEKTNLPRGYWVKVHVRYDVEPKFVLKARAVAVRVLF
jgi:hypothetical protein